MTPYIRMLRAVTAVFFRSLLSRLFLIGGGLLLLLYILVFYLTYTVSHWWAMLLLPLGLVLLIIGVAGFGLWIATSRLLPRKLTREESRRISRFTNDLLGAVEQLRTPLPLLGMEIAKDVIRGRGSRKIESIINTSRDLATEFKNLTDSFSKV